MYTIGQLADLVGVSTKALRIYERKGMIQPVRNQVNYRLYDEEAKIILQKIIMLKFLGFSLDQIKIFLENHENLSLEESFEIQKGLLEQKKSQLETVISCMDKAIWECRENKLNMNEVLEEMNPIIKNRKADEMVWELTKYSPGASEWNRWVFEQAGLNPHDRVLDAGAGWGGLWRKNWDRLPENLSVTCVDKHNTWADNFAEYVQEQLEMGRISEGCFSFCFGDMEEMEFAEQYDIIFFNHTAAFMKDGEKMLRTFDQCLASAGTLICTWGGLLLFDVLHEWLSEYGTGVEELEKKSSRISVWMEQWEERLKEVFPLVQKLSYEVELFFEKPVDCYEFILKNCKELKSVLDKDQRKFFAFLQGKANRDSVIQMRRDTYLYRCTKECV